MAKHSISSDFLAWLKKEIKEKPAGTRLPSDLKLSEMWNVSRVTIRRKMKVLESET